MKSFKEIICSRRGIAIELAMMVMLLAVAFGIVFLTVNVLQTEQVRDTSAELKEQIAIDEAGEWAVAKVKESGVNENSESSTENNEYAYTYSAENKTIKVTEKESGNVVLTITISVDGGNAKILSWNR